MSFITRSQLSAATTGTRLVQEAQLHKVAASATIPVRPVVFLSHSHLDKDLVEAAAALLESVGANVYVDWLDNGLPDHTTQATAVTLRKKIIKCSRFIMLSSPNALASRWVPWELGCADGHKGNTNLASLIIRGDNESFSGNEYVGMYQTIEKSDQTNMFVVYGSDRSFVNTLKGWLNG